VGALKILSFLALLCYRYEGGACGEGGFRERDGEEVWLIFFKDTHSKCREKKLNDV